MNKVILTWNLVSDPETKTLPNWTNVAKVSLATNETYKDKNWNKQSKAEFHNLVAFWPKADLLSKYTSKGSKLLVEWKIQTSSWEAQDWTKRYRTEILVMTVELLNSKPKDEFAEADKKAWIKRADEEISADDLPF